MLKSTCKQAKENIRKTLLENLEAYYLEDLEEELSEKELLKEYLYRLISEINGDYTLKQNKPWFEVWRYNYSGHDPLYYAEMRETLKNWLEETNEEANKYNDNKLEHYYTHFLYRELNCLLKKHNLPEVWEVFQIMKNNFRNKSTSQIAVLAGIMEV